MLCKGDRLFPFLPCDESHQLIAFESRDLFRNITRSLAEYHRLAVVIITDKACTVGDTEASNRRNGWLY